MDKFKLLKSYEDTYLENGANAKAKKPFYKKWWIWLIAAVVVIIGVIGFAVGSDEEPAPDTAVEETKTTESTTEAASTYETMDDDTIVGSLNSSAEWSGEWKVDEDGIFVFYPEGELAEAFSVLGTSYTVTGEIPEEVEESFYILVDSMCKLSSAVDKAAGKPRMLSVANPLNTDNVILSFMSGELVYSAFEE